MWLNFSKNRFCGCKYARCLYHIMPSAPRTHILIFSTHLTGNHNFLIDVWSNQWFLIDFSSNQWFLIGYQSILTSNQMFSIDIWMNQLNLLVWGGCQALWWTTVCLPLIPHIGEKGNPNVGVCPKTREAWKTLSTILRFRSVPQMESHMLRHASITRVSREPHASRSAPLLHNSPLTLWCLRSGHKAVEKKIGVQVRESNQQSRGEWIRKKETHDH